MINRVVKILLVVMAVCVSVMVLIAPKDNVHDEPNQEATLVHTEADKFAMYRTVLEEQLTNNKEWHTGKLTAPKGFITDGPAGPNGNDGYETWFDNELQMEESIRNLRRLGYSEEEYPYWTDEETGVKMFGDYIFVESSFYTKDLRQIGDIVETSLGTAMVCAYYYYEPPREYHIDIATNWIETCSGIE